MFVIPAFVALLHPSRLAAAVTMARRWSGYVPEAKEAIVRWVKWQPLRDGRPFAEPDPHQTR